MTRSILLALTCISLFSQPLFCQNSGMPPVPEDAFFVTRISGASLSEKLPIAEMDAMPVFGELFKEFSRDQSVDSFEDFGVDYTNDTYFFAQNADSVTYFFWTLPLSDLDRFRQTILTGMRVPMDSPSPFSSHDYTVGWNATSVTFCFSMISDSYTGTNYERLREQYDLGEGGQDYGFGLSEPIYDEYAVEEALEYAEPEVYEAYPEDAASDAEDTVADAVRAAAEASEEAVEEKDTESVEIEIEDVFVIESTELENYKQYPANATDGIVEDVVEDVFEETVIESTETETYPPPSEYEYSEEIIDPETYNDEYGYSDDYEYSGDYEYEDNYYNYDLDYIEKLDLARIWRADRFDELMMTVGSKPMITAAAHSHVVKSKSDASAYFDYGAYVESIMLETMNSGLDLYDYGMTGGMYGSLMENLMADVEGTAVTSDIDFGKDEIVWNMDYHVKGRLAEMQKDVFGSKLSKEYLKYMDVDQLVGYYTLNFDTESLLKYYTDLSSYYVTGKSQDAEAGELAADLLAILIDEKGIADLIPGSMVLTFSDISTETVEYTTYDYNDDFEYEEVTRTKEEMMPTFLAMAQTHRPDMLEKILSIASRQGELRPTEWGFEVVHSPIPIYVQMKGNMLFIGNDMEVGRSIRNGNFKANLDGKQKKMIRKNSTVAYFNAERLLDKIDIQSGEMAEVIAFAQGKAKSMTVMSGEGKKGSFFAKMIMEVPEGEANGWSYLINVLNSFYEYDTRGHH